MKDKADPANRGVVVSVRGSVVDIRFDEHLPPIYSVLHAGEEGRIVIEVLAQLDARHVRGIALTPTQGLARGMAVEDTGGPLKAPVGKGILSRCSTCSATPSTAERRRRCPMAQRASGSAAAGATFHQIRNLRNGHQGHRCAGAAGARRQGGTFRRGGRRQDGVAHRNDSQHDRAPEGVSHFLRHRRTLPRRRGTLP